MFVLDSAKPVADKGGRLRTNWLCLCDCGRKREALTEDLRGGEVTNCCNSECEFHRPVRLENPTEGSFRSLLRNYRRNAKNKGREFKLTNEEFKRLTSSNCRYCGDVPNKQWFYVKLNHTKTMPYIFNGVDRVDSDRGYIIGNCVPCCKICNSMKLDLTVDGFINHINKVASHLKMEATI